MEGDFAEVDRIVQLGTDDGEGDGIAMESGEFRSHVVIVDEKFLIGWEDFICLYPRQRHRAEEGGGEDGGELGWEVHWFKRLNIPR